MHACMPPQFFDADIALKGPDNVTLVLTVCRPGKERTFCFAKHRRPEHYEPILLQKGVIEPGEGGEIVLV